MQVLPAVHFRGVAGNQSVSPEAYLYEAAHSDIYLGIFGQEYGYEDADGVSPTEREFDKATEQGNHRIIFVKRCAERNPKVAPNI